ncbi:acyl-CoA hydrolase [Rhodoligotrophos appendicifer]|uniref:acetyl-CoA hydrolase/transferase family protein n=1 Tax=Rhodoligotrophos appendicifer TaxID=987056 RepID=UPI001186807D|nr:acetyl-CoA hydrolase/transferase C-terminal domain-containing protein [Rhodoligotrophos appendicifer]
MPIELEPNTPFLSSLLHKGDRVVWAQGTAEPTSLSQALITEAPELGGVSAFVGTCFSSTLERAGSDHVSFSSFGAVGSLRKLAARGRLDIIPCHASQVGSYIRDGLIGCDVAFIQLSEPGPDGRHSLGLVNDYIRDAMAVARIVIAEINDQVPWTYGNALAKEDGIDAILRVSRPPIEVPGGKPNEIDAAIGRHTAAFIEDGATLQLGVGSLPDAVLGALSDRRDLAIHSGVIGDAVIDLVERGVITNGLKPIDTGISTTGTVFGTSRLYRFIDRNPAFAVMPSSYLYADSTLARLPQLVSINSALEVDLTGQVGAEHTAEGFVGTIGGQPDFVRAAQRSSRGHSIIAMRSTAGGGTLSRITHRLSGSVTTHRADVDIVITEFGVAELKGQTIAERARRLIAIAHPDFHETLDRETHRLLSRRY